MYHSVRLTSAEDDGVWGGGGGDTFAQFSAVESIWNNIYDVIVRVFDRLHILLIVF